LHAAAAVATGLVTPIRITLNGDPKTLDTPASVARLLVELGLDTRKIAVERNEEIVPRSQYAETSLASGDRLEIVHFVGGG
jgi:thiamine biosynthesis protein ThiS